MNRKNLIIASILFLALGSSPVCARKQGYRFKTSANSASNKKISSTATVCDVLPDSTSLAKFFPSSRIDTTGPDDVLFTGFDKKRNNPKESFFIINNGSGTIAGVCVALQYTTPDGRMLNKRYAVINVTIPAGETRKVDIPSWDTQHSFYYFKSESDPSRGNPFNVAITPLAIAHDVVETHDRE
ncbi:MAG: hypothetical protein K2K97_00085 [Muribaculaceae bacterium]|nr:hypothetical protein [Muribaculaceae bacterium]